MPISRNPVQSHTAAKTPQRRQGAYRLALVKGDASNSIGEFQNGDETLLSGARNVSDDVYLTVAVTLDEEHRSEQVNAIKKLLANTVISDATPKVALFGETLADDVSLEISDSYIKKRRTSLQIS